MPGRLGRIAMAAHDEMEIVTRGGERRVILWNNTILRNAEGSILGSASIGSDVTEQRVAERQLLYNAFHDSLTGLPNRALFLDRVEHALSRMRRGHRTAFAVLLLDVDELMRALDCRLGQGLLRRRANVPSPGLRPPSPRSRGARGY